MNICPQMNTDEEKTKSIDCKHQFQECYFKKSALFFKKSAFICVYLWTIILFLISYLK